MFKLWIQPVTNANRECWFDLFRQYLDFYKFKPTEAAISSTLERIIDPTSNSHSFLVMNVEQAIGLINYQIHPHSWFEKPVCYFQDMYVIPEFRRKGVAKFSIKALKTQARELNCLKVYWFCHSGNSNAVDFYNSIGTLTPWHRYEITLE